MIKHELQFFFHMSLTQTSISTKLFVSLTSPVPSKLVWGKTFFKYWNSESPDWVLEPMNEESGALHIIFSLV